MDEVEARRCVLGERVVREERGGEAAERARQRHGLHIHAVGVLDAACEQCARQCTVNSEQTHNRTGWLQVTMSDGQRGHECVEWPRGCALRVRLSCLVPRVRDEPRRKEEQSATRGLSSRSAGTDTHRRVLESAHKEVEAEHTILQSCEGQWRAEGLESPTSAAASRSQVRAPEPLLRVRLVTLLVLRAPERK